MDSLTARIMSRSGLSPVDPTLPPVHNVRMVYLKEPYGKAEQDLHEARVALQAFETSGGAEKDKDKLYKAMANLEERERDYYANRYFGRNKAILEGWNTPKKSEL